MKILALETSTKAFSLAVSDKERIICSKEIVLKQVLSDSIIPAIKDILKKSKLTLSKLDGFAIGLGPGSFTSLRVGMSTIKALAFATKKPVVGISSLDAIALNVVDQDCDEICVVADARRNLVYTCLYDIRRGTLKRKSDYMLTSVAVLLDQVNGRTLYVGDGIPLFRSTIELRYLEAAKEKATDCVALFADECKWFPRAANIVALAEARFKKKKFDSVDKLVPMYLYAQDCQVQKKT